MYRFAEAQCAQRFCKSVVQVTVELTHENTIGIPVAYNPKKIAACTRLVLLDDLTLHKMAAKEKEKKAAIKV